MLAASRRDTITFECHGATVRVRSDEEEVLAHLLTRLPPGVRPYRAERRPDVSYRMWRADRATTSSGSAYLVTLRDGEERERHELTGVTDARAAAEIIADDLEFRIALHSPRLLFVHAAAVAWAGRVIVFPGSTCAGKSTLAAELVSAGAIYYSDEFAVLDEEGLVHPFTRPLHLRGRAGAPPRDVHPAELGGVAASEPLPLGLVVATSYRAGARWRPRLMSPGRTALALFSNTVIARRRPAHAMALLARAIERCGARGVRSPRGEATAMVREILDLTNVSPDAMLDVQMVC